MPKIKIEEERWARLGRGLLFLFGMACLMLAVLPADYALNFMLRIIVGIYGAGSIILVLRHR